MTSCSVGRHNVKKDYLWSCVSGGIAGAGSALGALCYMILPAPEAGTLAAIACGTVSAALAVPLARRKIKVARPVLSVLGFCTAPLALLAMM